MAGVISGRMLKYYLPETFVESNFSGGICRDLPITAIPPGFVYDSTDWILDVPGAATRRGGTTQLGGTMGTGNASMVASAFFNGTERQVALSGNGHLFDAASGSDRGAFPITTVDTPKIYPGATDKMIVAADGGVTIPQKVYVSGGNIAFADLGGSPSYGKYVEVHQNRVVLGNSLANPNRIYFGPYPDTEATWNTSNSFVDTTYPITGLCSVQGVLLIFSTGYCERLIGSIPPGLEGANMELQPLGSYGCLDARSIVKWGANALFSNNDGMWITNGAGFDSLTTKTNGTGIATYWRTSIRGQTGISGVFAEKYLAYYNGATMMVCHLPTKSWWKFAGLGTTMFATASTNLYGVSGAKAYSLGSCFGGTTVTDEVGSNPSPLLQTRMIGTGIGLKAYEHGHLDFRSQENIALQYSRGLEAEGAWTAVPESPLVGPAAIAVRKRFILNFDAQAIQFRVGLSSLISGGTTLYAVETEARDATYGSTAEFTSP